MLALVQTKLTRELFQLTFTLATVFHSFQKVEPPHSHTRTMSHQYFDRDRDPRGGTEGGRAEYQDNNHRHQHRHPYHSPAAPEYSNPQASTTGGYSRHAGGERGESRDERGVYGGAERPYEQHVSHRRRSDRDWDRSAGGDMHSDRGWEREGQDSRNDWDTDRGSSRDNYGSRGRGVSSGAGYRDRDRPRSRSQSQSRSHSRNHSRNQDNSYRDRDNYWDQGDRDHRVRGRDRDRDRDSRDSRDRDRSPFFGAPPCRDVILEGFGFEISEDDILKELEELGVEGVETMHIIKDRNTGMHLNICVLP
ncbi:hypothetical protein BGX38DRAFT_704596 [Terfezia claveryi]|nr:hypothetical protein BGX38DRAFT_704596 [Terfezia claveryi]